MCPSGAISICQPTATDRGDIVAVSQAPIEKGGCVSMLIVLHCTVKLTLAVASCILLILQNLGHEHWNSP